MASKKNQSQKFRETARALESDEDESRFDDALRRVARHKPDKDSADKAEKPKRK